MVGEERRIHERRAARDTTFVVTRPQFNVIGRLKDISRGGLCFEHISEDRPCEEGLAVDIFLESGKLYILDVPCTLVYNTSLGAHPHGILQNYRCGVKFDEMETSRVEQVEAYIENYTIFLYNPGTA